MSSTPVLAFIKDISSRNVKAVADRLTKEKQSPNQTFSDPKEQGLSYSLLHKAVEVGSSGIVAALLAADADVNAADSRGRTPLHWVAACNTDAAVATAGRA
jgi:ankyrin repeat protein